MPEELRLKRVEYMKANPLSFWKGKKRLNFTLSEQGRLNIINGLKNRKVSNKVITHASQLNKGKMGENHPCWVVEKKRPLYKAIRTLFQYKNWRSSIFERDDYTCCFCLKRGGDIEADHYPVMFIEIIKKNNISNIIDAINCTELWYAQGRTLCRKCHEKTFRLSK